MKHFHSFSKTFALFSRPSQARSRIRFLSLLKVSALAALLFTASGCASTYVRLTWYDIKFGHPTEPKPPYAGTGGNVIFMVCGDEPPMIPILLISLPFDFALDTICLPYDIFSILSDKNDQWFWERVFEKNDTSLSLEEYSKHLTPVGKHHADNLLRENTPDATGKKVPATKEPKGKISPEIRKLYQIVSRIHEAEANIKLHRNKKRSQEELAKWKQIHADFMQEWNTTRSSSRTTQPSPPTNTTHSH